MASPQAGALLLTGDRLFKGEDTADTLAQVLTNELDLERVPAKARRLLRRCLEKDPKQRLRDIGDARDLLAGVYSQPRKYSGDDVFSQGVAAADWYYPRGVIGSWSRPKVLAKACCGRVCLESTCATRWGPFSPWAG